jgi:lipid II:glycine glycyltransferase (peptidoglycan interpeptide bridge formation enzyme)
MKTEIIDWQNPLWKETLEKLRHDVYHLPEYVYLEAKRTDTSPEAFLFSDGEKIFFVPYLLRKCDDILGQTSTILDILSPYGYPGILLSESAINTPDFPDLAIEEFKKTLNSRSVCSAFIRLHPILSNKFNEIFKQGTLIEFSETVSMDLTLTEAEIWAHTRKGHQSTINKCKRLGFTGRMVSYAENLDTFKSIYEQTMNRVEAKESYYFDDEYFNDLLKLGDKIHLCLIDMGEEIAAACLFFENCGIVQAHLGGTKNEYLSMSPFNYLLHFVRLWAKERRNEFLHIGGGVGGAKDNLLTFKTGFSRQRHTWMQLRLITDEEKYQHLVEVRAQSLGVEVDKLLTSDFFPAYRG